MRSLRMQELSEGEESTSAVSPPRGGLGPPNEEDLSSASAQQQQQRRRRRDVASSVASVDEDEGGHDLDEEGAVEEGGAEEPIDYVSLLLSTSAAPPLLSTPEEQQLLQQLSLLGFDTGQVSHSIRTSACDSCSAIWWMLRRKREAEVEREEQAAATVTRAQVSSPSMIDGGGGVGDGGGESGGEGKLSRTNSLRSIRRYTGSIRDPAAVLNDSPDDDDDSSSPPPPPPRLYRDEFLESLTEEQGPLSPLPITVPLEFAEPSSLSSSSPSESPPHPSRERTSSRATTTTTEQPPSATARAPSPPHTPPRRPSVAPVTPAATLTSPTMVNAPGTPSAKSQAHHGSVDDAEARLSFFLNAAEMPSSASASAILSYFPTVDAPSHHSSPTAKRTGLSQSLSHNSLSGVGVGEPAPSVSGGGNGGEEEEGNRGDRARAGSVSLLARATTAIGQGLASLSQTGTAADDVEGGDTPRQSSSKLPVPPASRSAASTTATPSPNLGNKPLDPNPSRPIAIHASASAPMAIQGYNPIAAAAVSPSPRPATRLVVSSSPAASPARSTSLRTLPLPAATKLSSSSAVIAGQQRQVLGRSASSASTQGGGSKKNKGGNLLNTFKHWFGQDPRKRKRVSMSPRLGAVVGSDISTTSGGGGGSVSVGRSHSMYVASTPARVSAPLAIAGGRPLVGSRKSSYNSAYAGAPASAGSAATMSRRSSVSSAHRGAPFLSDHAATPMRNGGQPRRRRLSDASRTSRNSLSERGDNSRPSSVRSYGGPGGGGSATRRHQQHRHSTGGASSSPSGSYITAKEMYRRPPTTTTVRRRHGSRGRPASEMAGTSSRQQHRRTASGASSIHRSSSGSMIAGGVASDDDDYVDEDDVGEDPIMEEDEEEGERHESAEQSRDIARAKALRLLSGVDDEAPAAAAAAAAAVKAEGLPSSLGPPLVSRSSTSSPALSSTNTSLRSSTAPSSSHHHATTFTAHKTTHLFGSPLQPRAPTTAAIGANPHLPPSSSGLSRRATIPVHAAAAPRRDVFAPKETTNGDWVDEDDELAGYGGGLGQGNTNSAEAGLDRSSLRAAQPAAGGGVLHAASSSSKSGPQVSPGLGPSYVDSPVAGKVWSTTAGGTNGSSAARFESRYAGIAGAALSPGADMAMLGTTGDGLASAPPRQSKWAQAAPDIVEEEEE